MSIHPSLSPFLDRGLPYWGFSPIITAPYIFSPTVIMIRYSTYLKNYNICWTSIICFIGYVMAAFRGPCFYGFMNGLLNEQRRLSVWRFKAILSYQNARWGKCIVNGITWTYRNRVSGRDSVCYHRRCSATATLRPSAPVRHITGRGKSPLDARFSKQQISEARGVESICFYILHNLPI